MAGNHLSVRQPWYVKYTISRLGASTVMPCALASRSRIEGRTGAATAAPPRPRRRIRRLNVLFMVVFPIVPESTKTEGVGLRVVGHHRRHRVTRAGLVGAQLVDDAGVVLVRGPAGREGDGLLGVAALGVGGLADLRHQLGRAAARLRRGRDGAEDAVGGRVDVAALRLHV